MSGTTVLGPGVVVTAFEDARGIEAGAVAWEGERIVGVGRFAELVEQYPNAERLDAAGGLILPGLVNLHHHFYSALARGLDPGVPLRNFKEILEGLWWRLDRALDPETVRLSAALSAAECIRWGCTTVFDHHASPSCLAGSLGLIAGVVEEAGLSAVLSYEVSDRNGHDEALAGVEENLEFIGRHRAHPRLRGMLGLHASFTLDDATLKRAARDRPPDAGIHVHVAEDRLDVEASRERYGAGPVERLRAAGLLDDRALLVHGIHLETEALAAVADAGAVIVHCPESNANNGVGRLDVPAAVSAGCTVGLGTDGMSSNALRAVRAAFLALRGGAGDPSAGFSVVPGLLAVNARAAGRVFGEPLLGRLEPGAPADVVVIDGPPPTPVTAANAFGHLVYGAAEDPVRHTVAHGRILLRDGRHTTVDPGALAAEARRAAPALWERFAALTPGKG